MSHVPIPAACHNCKHFRGLLLLPNDTDFVGELEEEVTVNCDAFPSGIPESILEGRNMHKKRIPGDNGLQFEEAKI